MLARAIPRDAFARRLSVFAWETLVAVSAGHAVTSTLLGRTVLSQATFGWMAATMSVTGILLIWLESSWERAQSTQLHQRRSSLRTHILIQIPLLVISTSISLATYASDYWNHHFITLLQPAPTVALLLTVLVTAVAQEVILGRGAASWGPALQIALVACRRWALPVSLLLLGLLEASSYLWVVGNDFTRYWAVADATNSAAGYPASRHQPVYIAAGMHPYSIELPFFPLLLLISFSIFGHDTFGALVPGLLANTALPLLLYGFYRRAGLGRSIAFAASCSVVAIPFFRLYTLNAPVPDAVFEALLVGTGYLFLQVVGDLALRFRSPSVQGNAPWILWPLFGLLSGLTALTRPDGVVFVALMFAALVPCLFRRCFHLALGTFLATVGPFSLLMMSTFGLVWPRNQGTSASIDHMASNLDWLGRYCLRWYAEPLGLSPSGFTLLVGLIAVVSAGGILCMAVKGRWAVVLPLAGVLQIGFVFSVDPRASGADQWFDFFRHVSYSIPFLVLPVLLLFQGVLGRIQRWFLTPGHGQTRHLRLVHALALCLLLLSAYELRLLAFPSASYQGLGRQFLTSDVWVSLPDILHHRYSLPRLSFVRRDGVLEIDPDSKPMARHARDVVRYFAPVSSLVTGRGPGYQLSSMLAILFGAIFAFAGASGTRPDGDVKGEQRHGARGGGEGGRAGEGTGNGGRAAAIKAARRLLRAVPVVQLAGGQGFEPRLTDPESAVLPLDDPPTGIQIITRPVRGRQSSDRRLRLLAVDPEQGGSDEDTGQDRPS